MFEKKCTKCYEVKSPEEFHHDKRVSSDRCSSCKACLKKRMAQYCATNRLKLRAAKVIYEATPSAREKRREATRRHGRKYRTRYTEAQRKRRRKNPERARIYEHVAREIRAGRMVRPELCARCNTAGRTGRIEASHDDYSKPLEVEWLCVPCHRRKDGNKFVVRAS